MTTVEAIIFDSCQNVPMLEMTENLLINDFIMSKFIKPLVRYSSFNCQNMTLRLQNFDISEPQR